MTSYSLSHLRGRALEASYDRVASAGARTLPLQLAHLAELDHQGYYLDAGCRSMFRYCVSRKGLSEDVAVQWIRAARIARAIPQVFEGIAEGRLNVSAVCLLAKHLTPANAPELLAAAEQRSIRQVTRLIAERFGRPSRLDPAPSESPATLRVDGAVVLQGVAADSPATLRVREDDQAVSSAATGDDSPATLRVNAPTPTGDGAEPAVPSCRARIEPIGPGRFELVAILDQEMHDQLMGSKELLGHAIPSGALVEVLQRAIALQHEQLRKRRCGAAERPRTNPNPVAPRPSTNPRRVPRVVCRAVWKRDADRCSFVSADGHRCEERERLELDHIVPVARGGQSTVENLRLLCSAHNQHAAERELGRERMLARREESQRRRAAERFHKQADRERVERRKAEIERQREALGEAFRNLGYRGAELERALACCATRPEASLEERIKYALSFMAPKARKESPPPASAA